ncbi:MAG: hypothetical protein Q9224_005687, partial [Gallowayella concinna]
MTDAVVTTGVGTYRDDERLQAPWLHNPRFSHRIIKTKDIRSQAEDPDKKTMLPAKEQLVRATSKDQVFEILIGKSGIIDLKLLNLIHTECFLAKLRMILQITDSEIDIDTPLMELGVDSLVAVEVRSWFLKELAVDIPVLKVVGGATPSELCQSAMEQLPKDLLTANEQESDKPREPHSQPQMAVSDSTSSGSPISHDDSGSTASSTQLTTTSGRSDRPLDPTGMSPATKKDEPPTGKVLKSEQLSLAQTRFWFLGLLLKDPTTFNVAYYYRVSGLLRVGDLERAVGIVAARHEALSTCFLEDQTEADQAHQKIMSSSALRLEHREIKAVEDVATEYAKLKAHVFDLAKGDTLRIVLLSLSQSTHFLLINYHHIVMDGSSLQVMMSDLEKAYNNESLGGSPRQYSDFSATQRQVWESGEMNEELRYWKGIFPAGEQLPVLPLLPMAHTSARMTMEDYDTHQVECRLDPRVASRGKSVSKAQRSTPFHLYLAAFKSMLFRFTDAQDLTIGIADAGRNASEVMDSIGLFLNLLALRFHRRPDQPFADAIIESRDTTSAALEHSRVPFDVLLKELNVGRTLTHSPFFQVFLNYHPGLREKHAWANCQFEIQEGHPGPRAYDITLNVVDNATDAVIMMRVQKSLYDFTAAKLLMETFVHIIDILSIDASLPLKATPPFSKRQMTHANKLGYGPSLISDWPGTLPHRIDHVARANGDKVALMDGTGRDLTYGDMINRIESISEALTDAGSGAGSLVLVFQQATSDWVCSMLAVMRVGSIYVPLDLRNPLPRLAAIANDCKPSAVLVDGSTFEDATQLNVPHAVIINISK